MDYFAQHPWLLDFRVQNIETSALMFGAISRPWEKDVSNSVSNLKFATVSHAAASSTMDPEEIRYRILSLHETRKEIAQYLQQKYPGQTGFSVRSVRRFCKKQGITRRSGIDDDSLDYIVEDKINVVGHSYGRKTMAGLLAADGMRVGERRVGRSLKRIAPEQQALRARVAHRLLNPVVYIAHHFGHKLHLDQNEKLVMYGVTEVLAIDGYSRKVVGFVVMPVKNAVAVYAQLFRPLLQTSGLWDQLRTDKGREFDLILAVQDSLSGFRRHTEKEPYKRTQSIHNLRAERFWGQVNQRVNYPLKAALRFLEENERITLSNPVAKFSISWVAMQVAYAGAETLVSGWNEHRIAGRSGGIPNVLAHRSNMVAPVVPDLIPSVADAVEAFHLAGGHLTLCRDFGLDLLEGNEALQHQRLQRFLEVYKPLDIFSEVVHQVCDGLSAAIHYTTTITQELIT